MSKTHNNTFITRCYYVISFGPILYQHNLTSGDNSNTINVFFLNHLSASNIGQKGFIFTDQFLNVGSSSNALRAPPTALRATMAFESPRALRGSRHFPLDSAMTKLRTPQGFLHGLSIEVGSSTHPASSTLTPGTQYVS